MALSRVKTWTTEILQFADLNAEFDNILNNALSLISPLTADLDCGGFRLTTISKGSEASPGLQFTGDANLGIRSSGTDIIEIVTAGADRWQVNASGHLLGVDDNTYDIGASGATRPRSGYFGTNLTVASILYVNDSANADMTTGVTINQGGSDNQILAFKSSDVATGQPTIETDTFGSVGKLHATEGGTLISGYSSANAALRLYGSGVTVDTTKTTTSVARILCVAEIGGGAMSADSNLLLISQGDFVRFIFDNEGSGHADVEWTTYDAYDDVALMDAIQTEGTDRLTPRRYGQNSAYYNREFLEQTGIIGKHSWHSENSQLRSMVNFTRLAMLHHGAILQVADNLQIHEKRLSVLEQKLLEA